MNESERELKRRELWKRLEESKRKRAMLLGERFYTPLKQTHYQNRITLEQLALMKELRVQGKPTFPYALFLIVANLTENGALRFQQDVRFLAPLILSEGETRTLHTVIYQEYTELPNNAVGHKFEIYSASDKYEPIIKWTLHCNGFIQDAMVENFPEPKTDIAEWKRRFPTPVDFKPIYDQLRNAGIILGEDLRITEASKNETSLIAHIRFPVDANSNEYAYSIPAVIEACLYSVLGLFTPPNLQWYGLKITSIDYFLLNGLPKGAVWCGVMKSLIANDYSVDMTIVSDEGEKIGYIIGMRFEYRELEMAENNS